MISKVLTRIREEKGVAKTEIANKINVDVGHLTHIEKGERNPSHKVLKQICDFFKIPYNPIMHTYDRKLTEEQLDYGVQNHIICNSIPVFNNLVGYKECPEEYLSASFIVKANDPSMAPKFNPNDYVYIDYNAPLNSKDYGLFLYEGQLLLRKFIVRKNDIVLRAESSSVNDICLPKGANYQIIGKVLGKVK